MQRADLEQRGCWSQLLPRPHFSPIPGVTERLRNPGLLSAFLLQSNDSGFICDGDPGWGSDLSVEIVSGGSWSLAPHAAELAPWAGCRSSPPRNQMMRQK